MRTAGVPERAIAVFSAYYDQLEAGATGLIPESEIEPLADVDRVAELAPTIEEQRAAAKRTVVIKLNGGLGTSMGMDRAKSLLPVKGDATFLDLIVGQVRHVRESLGVSLPLLFMNSFRTRDDTLAALSAYPDLPVGDLPIDFVQNQEPKLRADDLTPVEWPSDPTLEWCPPGHADLYTALSTTGILDELIAAGYQYASVSNADNLGAAPDPRMMAWFAASGAPYASEVCRRTPADVKGGYLVVRRSDGRLVLRETAQTRAEDAEAANDITRHRYFHCNNLWFDLTALREVLEQAGGVLGLPLIRNVKNVDPTDRTSPMVIQIESAMGAAIQSFDGARAIEVDRSRFLPVKTTNDLLLLRSDVYEVAADEQVRSAIEEIPLIDLDPDHYATIADFDERIPHPLSLVGAASLRVRGDWRFGENVAVRGEVRLEGGDDPQVVAPGTVLSGG